MYKKREWESSFFKREIVDIAWEENNNLLHSSALVTTKLKAQDYKKIDHLLSLDFKYCEGEVHFLKDVKGHSDKLNFSIAKHSDFNEISQIVSGLYEFSRFRAPWFTENERDSFYAEWIRKAILGSFDDCCIILKDSNNGPIKGFVTIKLNNSTSKIGLLGVNPENRGQGIGTELLAALEQYCISKLIKSISVATQISNLQAINLYIKNGYHVASTASWFYKGINNDSF